MKELIEALHVIQDECKTHDPKCTECPLFVCGSCGVVDLEPADWKINEAPQKALL